VRKIIFITTLLGIFIITGCTSYIPPSMPSEKLAHVKEMKVDSAYITITKIDGIPTDSLAKELGFTNPFKKEAWLRTIDVFDVGPGRRTLDVMFERNAGFAHGRVTFIAEAGKTYHVMGYMSELDRTKSWWQANPQYVNFMVKDDVSGKIVSRKK